MFDEVQIGKLGVIKANAATYEKYLRTNGLLTDEPDDGRQEDLP